MLHIYIYMYMYRESDVYNNGLARVVGAPAVVVPAAADGLDEAYIYI